MAEVSVSYNSFFGSRGTGNGEFDYPTDICSVNGYVYIVDKQNHRIKKHDTAGLFISEFGSVGSGNDNFFFPEDVATDGVYLYITDGANHRIKKHHLNGVFVAEYGVRGTGNNEYEYPVGISTDGVNLYIADKGNSRVMIITVAGVYVAKYGTIGSGINNFNFPEGICVFDTTKIAVVDSGNKRVVVRRISDGLFLYEFGSFTYPSRISDVNGVLSVTDRQANKIYFYDYSGAELNDYSTGLFFPESVAYNDDKIYVVDSANHTIKILNFEVIVSSSFYVSKLISLTRQLYPTGRAWWIKKDGVFYRFHRGLALSESRAYADSVDLLNKILPDNQNFTVNDASRWETTLGLYKNSALSLDIRKEAIARKMNHPGTIKPRQSQLYIQKELRDAGFDVYVHENKPIVNPYPAIYGTFTYGAALYGGVGYVFSLIANYVSETKDSSFFIGGSDNYKQTFYIGGSTFGTSANVDATRKEEFRELILKLKPSQMAGFLLINYV